MRYDPATDTVAVRLDAKAITDHVRARRERDDKTGVDTACELLAEIVRDGRREAKQAAAAEKATKQ